MVFEFYQKSSISHVAEKLPHPCLEPFAASKTRSSGSKKYFFSSLNIAVSIAVSIVSDLAVQIVFHYCCSGARNKMVCLKLLSPRHTGRPLKKRVLDPTTSQDRPADAILIQPWDFLNFRFHWILRMKPKGWRVESSGTKLYVYASFLVRCFGQMLSLSSVDEFRRLSP